MSRIITGLTAKEALMVREAGYGEVRYCTPFSDGYELEDDDTEEKIRDYHIGVDGKLFRPDDVECYAIIKDEHLKDITHLFENTKQDKYGYWYAPHGLKGLCEH